MKFFSMMAVCAAAWLGACSDGTNFGSSSGKTRASLKEPAGAETAITALAVTPAAATLAAGTSQQFVATATYGDGSTRDLTSAAAWSITDTNVAELATDGTGLARALKVGTTQITAASGGAVATAELAVTEAALTGITVDAVTTALGVPVQLKATAVYSDGTTADITAQAVWSISDASLAAISNAAGFVGLLTPARAGSVTATATFGGLTGSGLVTITLVTACSSAPQILKAGEATTLVWTGAGNATYAVTTTAVSPPADLGTVAVSAGSSLTVAYTAPAAVATTFDVNVTATLTDGSAAPAACKVRLLAAGDLGVADDNVTNGLVGNVFDVSAYTSATSLMNVWFSLTPVAKIVVRDLSVPDTNFSNGFPGLPALTNWFAIRFSGQIEIPAAGDYRFQLRSDDGARLYIDDTEVVANDGVHVPTDVLSAPRTLSAGKHKFRVDYFQGPPNLLALTVKWVKPGDSVPVLIPSAAFSRPVP